MAMTSEEMLSSTELFSKAEKLKSVRRYSGYEVIPLSELVIDAIVKMEDTKPEPSPSGFYRDESGWTHPINPMGY